MGSTPGTRLSPPHSASRLCKPVRISSPQMGDSIGVGMTQPLSSDLETRATRECRKERYCAMQAVYSVGLAPSESACYYPSCAGNSAPQRPEAGLSAKCSAVAQWQSIRLLIGRSLVRPQPAEPVEDPRPSGGGFALFLLFALFPLVLRQGLPGRKKVGFKLLHTQAARTGVHPGDWRGGRRRGGVSGVGRVPESDVGIQHVPAAF